MPNVDIGFRPPASDENKGLLGRLWDEVWRWFAPGWKDEKSDIIVRGTGANDPVWSQIGATDFYGYAMVGTGVTLKQFWSNVHINHDYRIGTPIYLHIHWIPETNGTGNVKWNISVALAKGHNQQAFNFSAPYIFSIIQAAPGILHQHMIAEINDTNAKTLFDSGRIEPDTVLHCRVWRDPADADDTYGAIAYVDFFDAHYQVSRFATKNKAPNFYT